MISLLFKRLLRVFSSNIVQRHHFFNAEECSNYCTIALISHVNKIMLNILQARLQQYVNRQFPDVKLVLEEPEEPGIKLPTSDGMSKKQESSRKTTIFALLIMPKPLTVWITINCGKF